MKKLTNRKLDLVIHMYAQDQEGKMVVVEKKDSTTYFKHCRGILKNPPAQGWKDSELDILRKRLKLLDILDNQELGGSILLEDDLYAELLKSYTDNFNWLIADKKVIEFSDWIKSPEEVTIKEEKLLKKK